MATGDMSIVDNPSQKASCRRCKEKILDNRRVEVEGYRTGYGKVNYFYYHIKCIRDMIKGELQ